jgi:hypothetical protein
MLQTYKLYHGTESPHQDRKAKAWQVREYLFINQFKQFVCLLNVQGF